jgi:pimeloyl-[acyl-carrier protein] methyl ester esterase
MSLHIKVIGKGSPLVFIHGWGFDHKIWLQLASQIDSEYQLFLVDLPGFGLSSAMSWERFKQNLAQQLPAQFALAGWSMGGLFATRFAIEEPTRITKLINISSSPCFIKEKTWPGIEKQAFNQFFVNLTTDPQLTISEFIGLQLRNNNYQYQNELMPNPASLKEGLEILANWDLREPLHLLTRPAYFLFGHLDAITPRTTMAAMQKIYPQFNYLMFAKAAHMPFLSDQNEFITVLKDILR